MTSRVAQMIRFFVERVPGAGRTQIVKFLYLADVESRRYLGRPISDLDYIWYDHGPFDSEILSQLDQLCDLGLIAGEKVCYPGRKAGYRYNATKTPVQFDFSKEERAILDYVAATYCSTPLQVLLEDVVYQTKPMLDAKEREAEGGRLRMELVDNEYRIPGMELERITGAIEDLDNGRGKPLREVVASLKK
jgi:hypothetical protein